MRSVSDAPRSSNSYRCVPRLTATADSAATSPRGGQGRDRVLLRLGALEPVAVIEFFQRFAPAACLRSSTRTTPQRYSGQPGVRRMEGSWGLVFLAHIMTGNPDWQNWYHDWQDSRLWEVCGFERTPSWMTVWTRASANLRTPATSPPSLRPPTVLFASPLATSRAPSTLPHRRHRRSLARQARTRLPKRGVLRDPHRPGGEARRSGAQRRVRLR